MRNKFTLGASALLAAVCALPQSASTAQPAAGAPAAAGQTVPSAFGLKRGQPVAKISTPFTDDGPGWSVLNGKPPQSHPEFEEFHLFSAPGVGLCAIRALGPVNANDSHGDLVRARFSRVQAQLTQRYGKGSTYDECDAKTSTCNPGYWSMHIKTRARNYGAVWDSNLPAGMKRIELYVRADDISQPYVAIQYSFDNEAQCEAALNAKESEAL